MLPHNITGVGGQTAQSGSQSAPPVPSTDTAGPSGGPAAAEPASTPQSADPTTGPVGRRIVDIAAMTDGIATLMAHTKQCWQPSFAGERRQGLELSLLYKCHKCGTDFNIAKEENKALNNQAVYAAVTTGSGFSAMEAQMALMDIPFMSFKRFSQLEEDVGEVSGFARYLSLVHRKVG